MRTAVAILFLAFQVAMIVYARFDPGRYFCWAPHDSQNEYHIRVSIDDVELDTTETTRRYRIPAEGIDPRAIEHVIRLVRQYERSYGSDENAVVDIDYRTNGSAVKHWRWPEQ